MELNLLSEEYPIISGKIGDMDASFLVDTGSSINMIAIEKMWDLGISLGDRVEDTVSSGYQSSATYLLDGDKYIHIDGLKLFNVYVSDLGLVMDSIYDKTGISIDGVIGVPGIKQLDMLIDLRNSCICLPDFE